jgi:hypothetical protein
MNSRRRDIRDRRPAEVANQRGHGIRSQLVSEMNGWQQGLYRAQLAFWQAACAYEQAIHQNVTYGLPVHLEVREEFERARSNWAGWLIMVGRRNNSRPATFTWADVREDYL